MEYFAYILKSQASGKFYCGQTENLEERIIRHNSGRNKSTKSGAPWVLVASFVCTSRAEAVSLESKIKKRGIGRFLNDKGVPGG